MMDAVEFVKTLGRMCNVECNKCEFWKRRSNFESCAVWQKTTRRRPLPLWNSGRRNTPPKPGRTSF